MRRDVNSEARGRAKSRWLLTKTSPWIALSAKLTGSASSSKSPQLAVGLCREERQQFGDDRHIRSSRS
jgi:hypothetical protein